MEKEQYMEIIKVITEHKGLSHDRLKTLKQTFPEIASDTIYSILFLYYQKKMKSGHSKLHSSIFTLWDLYKKGVRNNEEPGIMLRIAQQYDVCPYLMAKLFLQRFLEEHQITIEGNINIYLRDTKLIPDVNLSYEIFLCTTYDILYSPIAETMKHSLGQEYEIKLYQEVTDRKWAFFDENQLRKNGYDKTPDLKLDVPVAVDGFIINWIESKALFGDLEIHEEYTRNQYQSYWNRFGTGLVIYWFGFMKNITRNEEKQFIVRDHLPKDVIQLNYS